MSEPDSMVERVARAIRGPIYESSDVAEHMHEAAALRAARAAIEAMREPTEAMERAGFRINRCDNFNRCCESPTRTAAVTLVPGPVWKVMISAALD